MKNLFKLSALSGIFVMLSAQLFAHSISLYTSTGCATGQNITVDAVVLSAGAGTHYRWQYKNDAGAWVCFTNGVNYIRGKGYNVSGATGIGANDAPLLQINAVQYELNNLPVRCLMADNNDPCPPYAGAVWGGDDQALDQVRTFNIKIWHAATNECGANTPGCQGNFLIAANGYYGGFEAYTYDVNTNAFTYSNFTGSVVGSDYGWGNAVGQLFTHNNPVTASSSYTRTTPNTGNMQLIVNGDGNVNARAWYKTVTVVPGKTYSFTAMVSRFNTTLSDIVMEVNGVTVGSLELFYQAIGDWRKIGGQYTVPAGVTSVVIQIRDQKAAAGVHNYAIDDICFREIPFGNLSLGGSVFVDRNDNGKIDAGEIFYPYTSVLLCRDDNNDGVIDAGYSTIQTLSDGAGQYKFEQLAAGKYFVRLVGVPDYMNISSVGNENPDDNIDGDNNGVIAVYNAGPGTRDFMGKAMTLLAGTEPTTDGDDDNGNMTYDFGIWKGNGLGDFVFVDKNNDGVQQTGEAGLSNVKIELLNADNTVNQTTYSGVDGSYYFYDLDFTGKKLRFTKPDGFVAAKSNQGADDEKDSDPINGEVAVAGISWGAWNHSYDAGFVQDSDKDGVADLVDRDDDNDGISDCDETIMCDGTSLPDPLLDGDNDNVPNLCDNDSPGIPWADADGGGINDNYDRDLDGIINTIDLDSDNDGILDVVESGYKGDVVNGMVMGVDTDKDGILVGVNGTVDTDDNNITNCKGTTAINSDRDAKPNFLDADSDNDGITDVREASTVNRDLNNDGYVDGTDDDYDGVRNIADGLNTQYGALGITPVNTDGTVAANTAIGADALPDYMDIDTDNDGIPDNIEFQTSCAYILPVCVDVDCDGLLDVYDNNGSLIGSGMVVNMLNMDADGLPDFRDFDSDNDNVPDVREGTYISGTGWSATPTVTIIADLDNDGFADQFDLLNIVSTSPSTTCFNVTVQFYNNNGVRTAIANPGGNTNLAGNICVRTWRDPGVLPLTLLSFTGTVNNKNIDINWQVVAESNMSHYVVERSTNGVDFKAFARMTAHNKGGADAYATTDLPTSSIMHYRLRSVSKDGTEELSKIVIVRLGDNVNNAFVVAPNPAVSFFNINMNVQNEGIANIRLLDQTGKVVMTDARKVTIGRNSLTINTISQLAQGLYVVEVVTNGEKLTSKLLINK
jgi:hypothetical protein